jgi:DNA primase
MIPHHLQFKHLKQTVSIAAVLADSGLGEKFRKQGDRLVGPCPIHHGDNPHAFVVSLSKNLWRCFTRCNTGGDVVDFVRRLKQVSYRQTADYLAALTHTSSASHFCRPDPSSNRSFRPFSRRVKLDPFTDWLESKGIHPETAVRFEAGFYNGSGFLNNCIGVRLHDINGRPLGYAGRRLDPDHVKTYGKWKFPPGLAKMKILYNFHRIQPQLKKGLVIVEGPWAVMRLAQLNISAVALSGIHLSPTLYDVFRQTPQVILMLDGDRAGRRATVKLFNSLKSMTKIHYVHLPPNLDPDDLDDDSLSTILNIFFSD